ncbi:MAG: imidazoleglycerol-phosphate dehydratase HisB [Deltaproteobacteria bacterium]|nr:imidazoleglycerol-phosphate dehydratase HisB [Deltaproteobacteria bacterium]
MPANKIRKSRIKRETKETKIDLALQIDGTGQYKIDTPIPFFNHMLEAFARHGLFDLTVKASGDVEVDDHHLVEDVGLVLGQAFVKAVGAKAGMVRYGHFSLPMDDTLANVAVDFCGRPALVYNSPVKRGKIKKFDLELVHEFFQAITNEAGLNLHINVPYGKNKHHVVEAIFKSFAKSMDRATQLDPRISHVLSTKGSL